MASVFKRGQKRWYARIKVGAEWRTVCLPVTWSGPKAIARDKALYVAIDAEDIANRVYQKSEIDSEAAAFIRKLSSFGMQKAQATITTREFLNNAAKSNVHKIEETTLDSKLNVMRLFCAFIGKAADGPVHQGLTRQNAQKFVIHMQEKNYAIGSIKNAVFSLGKAAKLCMAEGLIFSNPFQALEFSGRAAKCTHSYSEREANSLLEKAHGIFQTLMMLMLCTGMRVGDAMNIQWKAFNFDEDFIKFSPDKQRRGRETELTIPLPAKLKRYLLTLKMEDKEARLAEGLSDSRLRCPTYFKSQTRGLELPKSSYHSCRHFYVSMLCRAGIREEIRMKLIGHKSTNKVHATYTHVELELLREEIAKVGWLA
jgi:integrase